MSSRELPLELVEAFQKLVSGDFSYRLPRSLARDESDALAFFFNAIAEEMERIVRQAQAGEARLNEAVNSISAGLMQVAAGDLEVSIARDYQGDPVDVLVYLVNTTIGELRLLVAKNEQRNAEIQARLEGLVEQRTAELREARDAAEAATHAKSAFLATMSHEIRTPLNAVIGMTGLLMETPLSPAQQEFASTIRTSGDALLAILNDILDFSKIEAGRIELENRPFDLRQCVESAINLLAEQCVERGLELSYVVDARVPAVICGDETRLRQILLNLLSNAIKFTESGEIDLAVSIMEGPQPPLHTLHFAVQDTGIGIPPDRMDRLFQAFSQGDSSTTRNYGGTGLGLVISRRLTELMGGRLWVESEGVRGKGSTFHFTVQAREAEAPPQAFLEATPLDLRGRRALIVDDHATNLRILSLQTAAWGMECSTTQSSLEALEWIRRGEVFQIALIDQQMPDLDGPQLAQEIRKLRDESSLPLVLISSVRASAEQGGLFAARLLKPVPPSKLYDTLVGILAGRRLPAANSQALRPSAFDPGMAKRLPLRILVAEDHATNQRLALLMLERLGYRADVAANGLEVLAALDRQGYDVVLMDVQMPEMDGLEATRRVRQRWPGNQGPRIIAMTASVTRADRRACMLAGMNDYLPKPIRVEALIAALSRSQTAPRGEAPPLDDTPAPGPPPAAPVAASPAPAALDASAVQSLLDLVGGDPKGLQALIRSFLDESPRLVAGMRAALDEGDCELLRRGAHTLKSSARDFGASQLSALCQVLEAAAKKGSLEGAAELLAQIEAEYPAVSQALHQLDPGGSHA